MGIVSRDVMSYCVCLSTMLLGTLTGVLPGARVAVAQGASQLQSRQVGYHQIQYQGQSASMQDSGWIVAATNLKRKDGITIRLAGGRSTTRLPKGWRVWSRVMKWPSLRSAIAVSYLQPLNQQGGVAFVMTVDPQLLSYVRSLSTSKGVRALRRWHVSPKDMARVGYLSGIQGLTLTARDGGSMTNHSLEYLGIQPLPVSITNVARGTTLFSASICISPRRRDIQEIMRRFRIR